MTADIKAVIEGNQIAVFVIQSQQYSKSMGDITGVMTKIKEGVCYVSLNKPCRVIETNLKKSGVSTEKVYFVDAVSSKVGSMEPGVRVIFVSSPQALTELSIAINKCLGIDGIDSVLFDSLSTLLVYEGASSVIKFVHSIINTMRVKDKSCVFTILKEDLKEEVIKDLGMFADKIEELT